MPKVSVIIPVYNVEQYLRECLDSVVNQTLKDIEIICVNDCTPDNSAQILSEYAQKDNRIKIITLKENGGLGNARNVGLKSVTSDYIMFLDSDDWLELDACESAYTQITKNNNDIVFFNIHIYKEKYKKRVRSNILTPFLDIENKTSAKPIDINTPFFIGCECWYKIYNTKFFINNNLTFDKGAFEDQTFNVRMLTAANSISILNKPLYNYRIRKNSISRTSLNWKDYILAKQKAYDVIKSLNNVHPKLINFFLIASINTTLIFFKRYSENKNIRNNFYKDIHKFFSILDMENTIEEIKNYIDYKNFKLIVKNNTYNKFIIQKLININIFSIQNSNKHHVITVFGIKCKIKKYKI